MSRPYVILSVAQSIDGFIDDNDPGRLVLSSPEDFDRVDQAREGVDAILVGATVLRRDNPTLRVKSEARRKARVNRGEPPELLRVIPTRSGNLPRDLRLWGADGDKLLYCPPEGVSALRDRLAGIPGVEVAAFDGTMTALLEDLSRRGVRRLMVEGGEIVHTQFLQARLVDELHLTISGFWVADPEAPRFTSPGIPLPYTKDHRLHLADVSRAGETAVLTYLASLQPDADALCWQVPVPRRESARSTDPERALFHSRSSPLVPRQPGRHGGASPVPGKRGEPCSGGCRVQLAVSRARRQDGSHVGDAPGNQRGQRGRQGHGQRAVRLAGRKGPAVVAACPGRPGIADRQPARGPVGPGTRRLACHRPHDPPGTGAAMGLDRAGTGRACPVHDDYGH